MANSLPPVPTHLDESVRAQTKIDSDPNNPNLLVPVRQTAPEPPQITARPAELRLLLDPRRLSLACLLITPFIALPVITRVLVDHFAPAIANVATTTLEYAFGWRDIAEPDEDVSEPFAVEPSPFISDKDIGDQRFVEPNTAQNFTPDSANSPNSANLGKRHRGIVVRTDAVVRAVRSGGRPSSFPAPASGNRPAGLALVGVSHYGTGLRDGDVLTSVGGTPATSESAIVATIAGAIGQGAKVITGVVWRDNQRMDVAVEIPGPEAFARKKRRRPASATD